MDAARKPPALVPELDVTDLAGSLTFYAVLGFGVQFSRPEEGFAYLARGSTHLML